MRLSPFLTRKSIFLILVSILFVIIAVFFAVRGVFLRKSIVSLNTKISRYGYVIHWDDPHFKGIRKVYARGIYVQSRSGDNELFIDSVSIQVRILPLFLRQARIRKLDCRSVSVRYYSGDPVIQETGATADSADMFNKISGKDLAGFAGRNIRRFFSYIPARVFFGKIEARYIFAGNNSIIALHNFTLLKGRLNAVLHVRGNEKTVNIPVKGKLDKKAAALEFNLIKVDSSLLPVPVLKDKYGIAAGFDSLKLMIGPARRSRHLVNINGAFSFSGLELEGERLSLDKITIGQFQSTFRINIGNDFIEMDSSSFAYLNQIRLRPYLKISVNNSPVISFKILQQEWNAQEFFNSLPQGMFTSLQGFKAEGVLHYFLDFSVELNNPDSLKFNTRLLGKPFRIVGYGADDYRILNRSFTHRVYERNRLISSFIVGPENPDFVPFESISPFLRAAVMTSEDGSFFYHNGFNPNAFRESIVANIKEKRFARGGSTISMQLIKNVFLTRNKTLARKIEEALIVWLIESNNLVSKQRMYEVYLNIIEWGPGIYGIRQAGRFYFDKTPAELNLQESVYLASIVPRPKWYRYTFDRQGIPRAFYSNYFNRLKDLMVRKEFITAYDTMRVAPAVMLTGSAASVFTVNDSSAVDSVSIEDLSILPVF